VEINPEAFWFENVLERTKDQRRLGKKAAEVVELLGIAL